MFLFNNIYQILRKPRRLAAFFIAIFRIENDKYIRPCTYSLKTLTSILMGFEENRFHELELEKLHEQVC